MVLFASMLCGPAVHGWPWMWQLGQRPAEFSYSGRNGEWVESLVWLMTVAQCFAEAEQVRNRSTRHPTTRPPAIYHPLPHIRPPTCQPPLDRPPTATRQPTIRLLAHNRTTCHVLPASRHTITHHQPSATPHQTTGYHSPDHRLPLT